MTRFLVLYRAPVSARQQMTKMTPEQAQAGMDLWTPLGDGAMVGNGEAYSDVAGYSILEAVSHGAVVELLQDHPHFHTPSGQVEVHEMLPVPGA
jgi:hypothetical protein